MIKYIDVKCALYHRIQQVMVNIPEDKKLCLMIKCENDRYSEPCRSCYNNVTEYLCNNNGDIPVTPLEV